MAKIQYVGVDGVARKVKKQYIGVDGIARNIKNSYVGVDGVARQYFASGVKWKKYNCSTTKVWAQSSNASAIGTTRETTSILRWSTQPSTAIQNDPDTWDATGYRPNYLFSKSGGFSIYGNYTTWKNAIGYYLVQSLGDYHYLNKLNSYTYTIQEQDENNNPTKVYYHCIEERVGYCYVSQTQYNKGSTLYGEVTAPESEYPENLTYVEGSLADGYYVLKSGSTYYYYELVEE